MEFEQIGTPVSRRIWLREFGTRYRVDSGYRCDGRHIAQHARRAIGRRKGVQSSGAADAVINLASRQSERDRGQQDRWPKVREASRLHGVQLLVRLGDLRE